MSLSNFNTAGLNELRFNQVQQRPDGLKSVAPNLNNVKAADGVRSASGSGLNIDDVEAKVNSGDLSGAINLLSAASVRYSSDKRQGGFDLDFNYNGTHYSFSYNEPAAPLELDENPIIKDKYQIFIENLENEASDIISSIPDNIDKINEKIEIINEKLEEIGVKKKNIQNKISDLMLTIKEPRLKDYTYTKSSGVHTDYTTIKIDSRDQNYSQKAFSGGYVALTIEHKGFKEQINVHNLKFDTDYNITSFMVDDNVIELETSLEFDEENYLKAFNEYKQNCADVQSKIQTHYTELETLADITRKLEVFLFELNKKKSAIEA